MAILPRLAVAPRHGRAILACALLTLHNVHFYLDLVAQARAHIEAGDYATWHRGWIERFEARERAG